ncbi:MAG: EpsI family protein [Candidatus Omnitrophica bacterium]|nr:EpsI family protein [Smithellaceae bacterium]MDD5670897.1 EpsI family protein [Candidatus Omnitrophota bacterium]
MTASRGAYLLTLLVLAVLCLFPLANPESFRIDETRSPLFLSFPGQIGNWTGQDVEVDERTYEILETRNVLSRVYKNTSGQTVHLLLVSSRKDRRVAHPPEVCYTTSNFSIAAENQRALQIGNQTIPVKEFIATNQRNAQNREHVLYFYKVGDEYTTNYYSQQLRFAIDRLTRKTSEILLIRLSSSDPAVFPEFLAGVLSVIEKK